MNSFAAILKTMVERVPGATGAVFADWEGESVGEFSVELPTLDLQIAGAQWGLVWTELQRSFDRARLGAARELIIDGEKGSVLLRSVTDRYYVVLVIGSEGHLATALAQLARGVDALRDEM